MRKKGDSTNPTARQQLLSVVESDGPDAVRAIGFGTLTLDKPRVSSRFTLQREVSHIINDANIAGSRGEDKWNKAPRGRHPRLRERGRSKDPLLI